MGDTETLKQREGRVAKVHKREDQHRDNTGERADDNEGNEASRRRRRRRRYRERDDKESEEKGEAEKQDQVGDTVSSQPLSQFFRRTDIKELSAIVGEEKNNENEEEETDDKDGRQPQKDIPIKIMKTLPCLEKENSPDDIKLPKSASTRGQDDRVLEPETQGDMTSEATWHLDHLDPSLRWVKTPNGSTFFNRKLKERERESGRVSLTESPLPPATLSGSKDPLK